MEKKKSVLLAVPETLSLKQLVELFYFALFLVMRAAAFFLTRSRTVLFSGYVSLLLFIYCLFIHLFVDLTFLEHPLPVTGKEGYKDE